MHALALRFVAGGLICIWPTLLTPSLAQTQAIAVSNGSFEDFSRASNPPLEWIDCGFSNETPPDVHPSGIWTVYEPALHQDTYLGMVTRESGTWESVGQELVMPLEEAQCYQFSIYLNRSEVYWSALKVSKDHTAVSETIEKNFDQPVKFELWAGDEYCDLKQLLCASDPVDHTEWKKYEISFRIESRATHILLRAYYENDSVKPYNGNLLLDHMSDFVQIDCQ